MKPRHFLTVLTCLSLPWGSIASPAEQIKSDNGHRLITVPAGSYTVGAKGHPTNPVRTVVMLSYRIADTGKRRRTAALVRHQAAPPCRVGDPALLTHENSK